MSEDTIITAGTILIFESGCYSDYTYYGPFTVLKDIHKVREAAAYVAQWTPEEDDYRHKPGYDRFIPYLVKEGFIEDVPKSTSWHIGEYGTFKPE